jgi:DNA-binding SARP family transcriptional activator
MRFSLRLVGGFSLEWDRQPIRFSISAQRLIAYVALQDRPSMRSHVAGTLWPDSNDLRAMGNLRSVLWRLRREGLGVIDDRGGQLALAADVQVDVRALVDLARSVLDEQTTLERGAMVPLSHTGDLLPDWSDDWVPVERERFHQLRLHALESACGQLVHAGLFGQAVDVCLAAVAEEPLRESAQRQLIRLYLAEGNRVDALRQYEEFRRMLIEELGLEPSREIRELVGRFG